MAKKNSVRRIGRVSLAVIVSTAVAAAPQEALAAETPTTVASTATEPTSATAPTEPSTSQATASNTSDPADTAGIAAELNKLSDALNNGGAQPVAPTAAASDTQPGAGTSGTQFTSDGTTYTGLAVNPTNGKLYAIQPAKDGQQDDHLLRINPETGSVFDLGALTASGTEKPHGLSNATFTNDGTLVLFPSEVSETSRVFTLDLKDDNAQDSANREMKALELKLSPEVQDLEVDSLGAFASVKGEDSKSLYSFGIAQDTKPVVYRYNLEDQTLTAAQATIDSGVDQANVTREEITSAWTKGEGTLVAADADGETIEISGGAEKFAKPLISATSTMDTENTASEIAQTSVAGVAPTVMQNEVMAGDPTDANRAADGAATDTTTAETTADTEETVTTEGTSPSSENTSANESPSASEPSASESAESSTKETEATKPGDKDEDLLITVKDSDGEPLEGATVKVDDESIETDKFGEAYFEGITSKRPVVEVSAKGYTSQRVRLTSVKDTTVKLKKDEKKEESTPDQIKSVIKEFSPLLTALGVPAAALGGTAGGSKTTGTKTTSKSTSTASTSAGKSGTSARSTSGTRTISAGVTTSTAPAKGGAAANVARAKSANTKSTNKAKSASTTKKASNGKLADTGTPMSTVIVLGLLLLLVGGAYVFLGRRRDA